MFYRAMFMFPDHVIDEVSPLGHHQQNTEYPVFNALHMTEMGPNSGLYKNRPAPPKKQKTRYARSVLVASKDEANGSIAVFICSSSPRGRRMNSHRWMPIGDTPHLPNQPLPGVQIIPQNPEGMTDQAYLCFTHSLQVTPVTAYAAPLASTEPGNAHFGQFGNLSHCQIRCGNLAHVLAVHHSYWDGGRWDAGGRPCEAGQTHDENDPKNDNRPNGTEPKDGADDGRGPSERGGPSGTRWSGPGAAMGAQGGSGLGTGAARGARGDSDLETGVVQVTMYGEVGAVRQNR